MQLSHERHDAALELRYAATVRDRVHALVRNESECCAFLTFALDESGNDVRDLFFEPFLTSEAPPSTSGCCAPSANACCRSPSIGVRPGWRLDGASGTKVREWIGVVAESTLTTGLQDLLKR